MKISCFIVDDESDAIDILKDYIEKTPGLELFAATDNPLIALDLLTRPNAPDMAFIDIDMRRLSGLELAGMVSLYTTVVFTTAHTQYAIQAYEKEVFDYLMKPINYERFLKCIQRVRKMKMENNKLNGIEQNSYFNIKSEVKGRMMRIRTDEVMFIEGASNYVTIHLPTEKHMTYIALKDIERHLPAKNFVRLHRSYIVNLDFVKVIERGQIRLTNHEAIPLGDAFKDNFLNLMELNTIKGRAS